MSYVYITTEKAGKDGADADLFTVGFYDPEGRFIPESDHSKTVDAAARAAYLNGAVDAETIQRAASYSFLLVALKDVVRAFHPPVEADHDWWAGWHDKLVDEGADPTRFGAIIRERCLAVARAVLEARK